MPEFYIIFCPKNWQNILIFMTFARKVDKISEVRMIFARKMPEFYVIIARKIFFPNLGRGHVPPLPPSPTPMRHVESQSGWMHYIY